MTVDTVMPTYTANGNYSSSSSQDSTSSYYGNGNGCIQNQQQNASYQDRNVYQQQLNNRDSVAGPSSSYQQQQQQQHPVKQCTAYTQPGASAYQHSGYNSVAAAAARRHIQQGYDEYRGQQQLSPDDQFSPVSPENEVSLPYGIGNAGGSSAQQYQQQQQQLQQQQHQLQQQQQQGERSGSDSSDDVSLAECLAGGGVELMNLRPMPLLDENGQVLVDDGDRALQQQQRDDQYCTEQQVYFTVSGSVVPTPSDVYTIPEDEDELSSPTGADGVTSLRKRQMANTLTGQ